MIKHILSHGREKGICIDTINGTEDHLHLLIRLQSTQTIAKVMHSIKGQSAWWCNSNKLTDQKLAWAKGYYAASISPEILSRTRRYIQSQELHHFKIAQQYLQVISEPGNQPRLLLPETMRRNKFVLGSQIPLLVLI